MATTKTAKRTAAQKSAEKTDDRGAVIKTFKQLVNMTPGQIQKFLDTKDSKRVGFKQGGVGGTGESVGHKSGRRIITIKGTSTSDLSSDDVRHMRKVISYIKRHLAQGPAHKEDVKESRWRYSLMNWGHDPLK